MVVFVGCGCHRGQTAPSPPNPKHTGAWTSARGFDVDNRPCSCWLCKTSNYVLATDVPMKWKKIAGAEATLHWRFTRTSDCCEVHGCVKAQAEFIGRDSHRCAKPRLRGTEEMGRNVEIQRGSSERFGETFGHPREGIRKYVRRNFWSFHF